jgi:hypothetical protein
MKTNTSIKNIILSIIAIAIIIFLVVLTKDWFIPKVITGLGGFTKSEMKTTVDTLETKYNDIYLKYDEIKTKVVTIPDPIYIDNYIYTKTPTTNNLSITGKSAQKITVSERVKRYTTSITDTILDGNIETIISLDSCKIISQSLNYKPKIPYIREKIITIVKNNETILSNKERAYIGLGTDVNLNNQITPQVLYLSKKKWLYKVGYQKDLNNQLPNSIQIGIAKLF